jgi:MFS transporter, DHA1 family, tetracycline resistance protein
MKDSARGSTVWFILITSFLNLAGIGILIPISPFLLNPYNLGENEALAQGALFTAYSAFQFLAVPTLGALSDRFGRRPVLLISLFGTAVGYLIMGASTSLWMLFLGRIIDGITGGNLGTMYAYGADITTPQERTKFFGRLGSAASVGFLLGPALGGFIFKLTGSVEAPLLFAAAITLLNTIWGYFVMPESLAPERRLESIPLSRLNPFTQLIDVFRIRSVRLLLVGVLIWTASFAIIQSNVAYLVEDRFGGTTDDTTAVITLVGLTSLFTQGWLVGWLVPRFGELRLAIAGIVSMVIGFILIGVATTTGIGAVIFIAVLFNAGGNGLAVPTITGLLSQAVDVTAQGRIQGGNQSIQALGRTVGPMWASWMYTHVGESSPYFSGAVGLVGALVTVIASARKPKPETVTVGD